MELGHHLKKARESKRMSQQEVAEHLGISQKTLSNIESNKSQPNIQHLAQMEMLYGINILQILKEFGIEFKK